MLTETQLKNLEPLTNHPRFGKLLIASINQWKKEDVQYTTGSYGVTIVNEKYTFAYENKKCCLIGAAIIDKIPNSIGDFESAIYDNYFVTANDFYNLYMGFDSNLNEVEKNTEAYKFGKSVRKALVIVD